jgi:hemerythrin-like domain-containing protein
VSQGKTAPKKINHPISGKSGQSVDKCPDPIELLQCDHTKGMEALLALEEAVNSIEKVGFTAEAFQKISEAAKFIGSYMREHYEKEDRHLYPLLQKRSSGSPMAVRHERREMWQSFRELITYVNDIEDGRIHGTTIRELVAIVRTVVEYFRNHIEREDTVVFPMVKRLLTPDEYALLGKEIAGFSL